MKRFLIALFTFALNCPLIAQKLSSGFIVTLEKDTIKGFLMDGTDGELSSKITFKMTKQGSDKIEYQPSDLLGFGFDNGRIFRRFSITKTPTKGDSIFVFAKKILEGKISLYSYSKLKGDHPDIFLVNNYSSRTVHLSEPEKVSMTDESGMLRSAASLKHLGLISIAKGDSVVNSANAKKFKYNLKAIRNDILKYDETFKNFPVSKYQPQIDYFYNLSAGIPFNSPSPTDVAFGVAFYRNKYFPEKSRKLSFISGISYKYFYNKTTIPSSVQYSNETFRQQFLSLIPIGVNFQSDSKVIKPYFYFGAGIGFLLETNQHIDNYGDKGNKNEFYLFPALNVGAGLKIRIGSNFMIVELSPTGNGSGIFINLGYSF